MLSILSNTKPLSFSNILMNFLLRLPLATLWKNFELQSPSLTYFTLAFCLQCTSSLNSNSSNSPFLKALWAESWERFPSCSTTSMLAISIRMLFFLSFSTPNDSLFHSFNLDLTNCNFLINLWPSQPSPWKPLHQLLKQSLKLGCCNHMFSNLKGVGPHLNGLVSRTIGQWSDVHLGRTSWRLWGKICSHSFEYRNRSNVLHTAESCMFDQVKKVFHKRGSINSHSLINPSKSLMLGVKLEPPIFSKILLVTLKSAHTLERKG